MPYIKVNSDTHVVDGQRLTFRAPADCSQVTGLQVCYFNKHREVTLTFSFVDAYGKNMNSTDSFKQGALVEVILDRTNYKAFVQNANTNPYLEAKFNERPLIAEESLTYPDCFYRTVGDEKEYYNSPNDGYEHRTFERFNGKPVYSLFRTLTFDSPKTTGFSIPKNASNIVADAWYVKEETTQVDNSQKTVEFLVSYLEAGSPISIERGIDSSGAVNVLLSCTDLGGQDELKCYLSVKYTKD